MTRFLAPVLTVLALLPWAAALGYYSVSEEIFLEADGSGRATAVFRIESDDLEARREASGTRQALDAVPLTRALAEARCQAGGATLTAYLERHGLPGPARPDGEAVAYSEIKVTHTFERPEGMRPFYPGTVRFATWSKDQIEPLLTDGEREAIASMLATLPPESAPTFLMLTDATHPESPLQIDSGEMAVPGLDPRSADGAEYQSWVTIHFPWRVTQTNGHRLQAGGRVVRWKYPLAGMAHYRMIFLARMSQRPRGEIRLAIVLAGVAAGLLTYGIVWQRRRARAGMLS